MKANDRVVSFTHDQSNATTTQKKQKRAKIGIQTLASNELFPIQNMKSKRQSVDTVDKIFFGF